MKRIFLILTVIVALAAPLSGQVAADSAEPPQLVFVASPPPQLLQPSIALPSLVPGLPVATGYSRKKFEGKYSLLTIGHRGVSSGMNFISRTDELNMGTQWAREVERGVGAHLVTDPVVTEYVNRIVQNVVRASDMNTPFTVKVIDNDYPNAFSLPGGFLYIDSGLLLIIDDEAELAGVIGHEVAHVAARHSTRQISRGRLLSSIFEAATPKRGWGRVVGRLSALVAEDLLSLKFSRGFEEEADLLGMQYLYAAGYDLSAYPRTLEKLQERERGEYTLLDRIFSTHPVTQDRIKRCQSFINDYFPERETYQLTSSEFENVKVRIANLDRSRVYREYEEEQDQRPVLRRRSPDR